MAGLLERMGAAFATFVIAVLLLLPCFAVAAVVIMPYTLAVHGYARSRAGSEKPSAAAEDEGRTGREIH